MAATNTQDQFQEWNWKNPKSVKGIADRLSHETSNEFYRKHSVAAGSISRVPTYHSDEHAQYVLPNDFHEHIRLAAQAVHLSAMVNGRIFHAPLDPSKINQVLDVGCGTGIVTNSMAEKFPSTKCFGLDLSPVPDVHTHAKNVQYLQGNVLSQRPSQWIDGETKSTVFEQDKELFDYTFSRMQILGMYDWPTFIKTEFSLLKPGGWAEVQDNDWEFRAGDGKILNEDYEWSRTLEAAWTKKGMDMRCGSKAKDWMADAGFENIQTFHYSWPLNTDPGSSSENIAFAHFNETMIPELLHHSIDSTLGGKVSSEKIEQLKADMRRDSVLEPGKHIPHTVTIGRKPLSTS